MISNNILWILETQCTYAEIKKLKNTFTKSQSFDTLLQGAIKNPERLQKIANAIASHNNETSLKLLSCWDLEILLNKNPLPNLPLALSYLGNSNILSKPKVAIVGSRHPTHYGRTQCYIFALALAHAGFAIISGGAIGIDAIANRTALANGSSCVILGSSLKNFYPPSNHNLFNEHAINNNGLILSQFDAQSKINKWNFPIRNQTIASLADFVLIIEASKKSGSLYTAQAALEANIDVGALPGPIDSITSEGCNELISQGAFCITTPRDVIERLASKKLLQRPSIGI